MASEKEMRDYVLNFSLDNCARGNQGYNRVLLQLFGLTGHGKSSFINSCKYVLDGQYKMHAEAAPKDGGFTMNRRTYKLTDTITIVDNRGYAMMDKFEMGEIYAQLGNFLPLNDNVEWTKGYYDLVNRIEESEMDPNFTDILAPIFIYSVQKRIAEEEIPEVKNVIDDCRNLTGIFPIFVLTHKSSGNYQDVEKKAKRMGAEVVYAIENYTERDHVGNPRKHQEILKILYETLQDVEFRMEEVRNPKRERIERKKFMLKFIHEREQEVQIRKEEEEAAQKRRAEEAQRNEENARRQREEEEGRKQVEKRKCLIL
ncbi:uncharacterized protein O3C94_018720 [Discoglossus pictus]